MQRRDDRAEQATMPSVDAHLPVPLYVQIKEGIRESIESGELHPLDRVPSEIELAERYGVSRMTARKAVDHLVNEGFVFRQPGKGTFVAEPKIPHGLSTRLSFSASMERLGRKLRTRILTASIVQAPPHVARTLRMLDGAAAVHLRRLRIVDGSPAALHIAYLPGQFAAILEADLTGSLTKAMADLGLGVVRAQDTVEAVVASSDEARLLKIPPGSPLVRIEGVAFSADRQPLRYTDALYRGDKFRFALDPDSNADLRLELID